RALFVQDGQTDWRAHGPIDRRRTIASDRRGCRPVRSLASSYVRHASARRRRRSARRPGAARTRVDFHDADLHAYQRRATQSCIHQGAPASVALLSPPRGTAPFLHPDGSMSWMEVLPFVGGLLAAIAGGALVADAALVDETYSTERRKTPRPQRNRVGQGCLGGSLVCTALVLLSGGASPFAVAATFIGIALLVAGVVLNWHYLVDLINGPSSRVQLASTKDNSRRSDDFDGTPAPAYGWPAHSDD